ncbi:MAG: aminotransferase class V-fold PLP-dependent enzyme [Hydrococcus sp. RU_2_2]|nr:aminotransferase class V-fold PLP-dependent enzyme [Hydrococcus sp. RU_2_2]NJP20851.1 aminotransferase class V-fold PLP-dependent enzyme [Hydrococcus sp. CRU_1_1]
MDIDKYRQAFPGLEDKVYFNFGGQGILPQIALEAIIETYQYLQQYGPFSVGVNAWLSEQKALLRSAIAQELNVSPTTITLTENVTAGCNIPLWGMDWRGSDRILMTDCEHPGVIAVVKEISRRFGVEIDIAPIKETLNQGNPTEVIARSLRPNTRLVVLSHLLWNTGQVLPLAEIVKACREYPNCDRPIRILVDAAQSVGSLPLNLTELGVDFYAFTGHKWWCGPAGVGGLYIHPEAFEEIQPTFVGWRAVNTDAKGELLGWKNNGERFEVATSAYPEYEGLRAAIAIHQQWGTPLERYQKICQLSQFLWQELSKLDKIQCLKTSSPEAGLVSFRVKSDRSHLQIVNELEKRSFFLRTIVDPDCIRACVHYFTLESEIEQLVATIQELVQVLTL